MGVKKDFYGNEYRKGEDEKLKETEKEIEKILLEEERKIEKELKKQSKKSKINFRNWFKSLIKPAEVFREEKNNADLAGAVKNVGVSVGLLSTVMYALFFSLIIIMGGEGLILAIMYILIWIFLISIIYIIILFIISGILFLFAKIFGGKGSFTTQTYLVSLPFAGLIWIAVPLGFLSIIPKIGFLFSFLLLLVYIYALYPLIIALKETHNYSTINAGLTLLPAIIFIIIFIIFIIFNMLSLLFLS